MSDNFFFIIFFFFAIFTVHCTWPGTGSILFIMMGIIILSLRRRSLRQELSFHWILQSDWSYEEVRNASIGVTNDGYSLILILNFNLFFGSFKFSL